MRAEPEGRSTGTIPALLSRSKVIPGKLFQAAASTSLESLHLSRQSLLFGAFSQWPPLPPPNPSVIH